MLWSLGLCTLAVAADPVIEVGDVEVPDPHRWLEDTTSEPVKAWWRERDAETRAWAAEDGRVDAIGAWLDDWRDRQPPSATLYDYRGGTAVWVSYARSDPPFDEDGGEAWDKRLYVQRPAAAHPGMPVDAEVDRSVCLVRLDPTGRYLVFGRLDPKPEDADAKKAEPRECRLRLFDTETEATSDLWSGLIAGFYWNPDGSSMMVSHVDGRRGYLTEIATDGSTIAEHFEHRRRLSGLWWLPDGELLAWSSSLARGKRHWRTRILRGPPDDLEWLGRGFRKPWFGKMSIVGAYGDETLIRTDVRGDGYEVVRVDEEHRKAWQWRSMVAERPGMDLRSARRFGDELLTVWARDGLAQLERQPLTGGPSTIVDLGGPHTHIRMFRSLEDGLVIATYGPGTRRWWVRGPDGDMQALDGARLRPDVHFTSAVATSADGTEVPVSIVAPAGVAQDGSAPVWLTAYGGFGGSQSIGISPQAELWLAAGGVVAVAHARGGRERGEAWHESAKLENLDLTFEDVLAVARWLVDTEWTARGRILLSGTSNGGLTVAAVIARDPELFGAAWAHAGVFDLLRAKKFGRWWPREYGKLSNDEQAARLLAESPVHRAIEGRLPPVLVTTGEQDPVVNASHSYKLVAAWEDMNGGPVLLRVWPFGSHGGQPTDKNAEYGARDRYAAMDDTMAFAFRALGMDVPATPAADSDPDPPLEE